MSWCGYAFDKCRKLIEESSEIALERWSIYRDDKIGRVVSFEFDYNVLECGYRDGTGYLSGSKLLGYDEGYPTSAGRARGWFARSMIDIVRRRSTLL